MKSLNRSLLSYASQRAKGLRSPKSHEVSRPITLNCKLTTGNRTPATARPFLGSRPIVESSSSKCSKKLIWDGPRAPRQRSLSRARRGRGRRIFRSVRYSTRGMLDYNRRFGLKISNSDPHIWRSSVLGLGSCNFVHGTPNTEHHHHHHHSHHHSHHGHHHSRFHDHHEGHFSWFFNWKRGGINPYWVCTLTLKAGKIKTNLKPRMVHASSKGKHYSYGISFRNNAKMPHRQHQTFDPKSKTLTPKQDVQNQGSIYSKSKLKTGPIEAEKNASMIHGTDRRYIGHSKPKSQDPKTVELNHYDPVFKASKSRLHLIVPKPIAEPKPKTQDSRLKTINRTLGKGTKLKPSSWTENPKPKTSQTENTRPIEAEKLKSKIRNSRFRILKAELSKVSRNNSESVESKTLDRKPETGYGQLETHVHFPSSSPLKSPFKVVGAAALPE